MPVEDVSYLVMTYGLLASKVEADEFVNIGVLNVFLELLQGTLAAEAMIALKLHCAKMTLRNGLTLRDDLVGVADGAVFSFFFFGGGLWH